MNEEKKKTIKQLKQRAKEMLNNNYKRKIGDEEIYTIICEWENDLNLIDKLQKENKQLVDTNKKLYEMGQQNAIQEIFNEKWISKDKIRDKIKELEEDREKVRNLYQPSDDDSEFIQTYQILVLQELLEEE